MTDRDKHIAWMFEKPEGIPHEDIIYSFLIRRNFTVMRRPLVKLTYEKVSAIYSSNNVKNSTWNPEPYWQYMMSGYIRTLFLRYLRRDIDDAQILLWNLTGNTNPLDAKSNTLRYQMKDPLLKDFPEYKNLKVENWILNAVHVPPDFATADKECRIIFGKKMGIMEFLSIPNPPQKY